MLKRSKRWLCLLLALSMVSVNAASVYAEPEETAVTESSADANTQSELQSESDAADETTATVSSSDEDVVTSAESEVQAQSEEDAVVEETAVAAPEIVAVNNGDGTVDLDMKNYTKAADFKELSYAVWSAKGVNGNAQDDLKWYPVQDPKLTIDLKDHNDDLGDYYIHVYEVYTNGTQSCIATTILNVSKIERPGPAVTVESSDGTEKNFTITLKNFTAGTDTKNVEVAIWSDQNGQDDLAWDPMVADQSGNYVLEFNPAVHKTAGLYYAHVYENKKDGTKKCLCTTTFTVTAASCSSVEVRNLDDENGTAEVIVSGMTCPSGITRVSVPVWSKSNQSDLVWYQAKAQEDGTYTATIDISKHKYNVGVYQIHVYAVNGIGAETYVGSTTAEFTCADAIVSAEQQANGNYLLKAGRFGVSGTVKEIAFAVWSEESKQTDMKWFAAKYDAATNSAYVEMSMKDFKNYGLYNVHCWLTYTDNKMQFLGKTTINVEKASLQETTIETDNVNGTFKITIKGLESGYGVEKVTVPVWSQADQSDLVWYPAERQSDGTYTVSSSIAKHKYNIGTYQAHVYVDEKNGLSACLDQKSFSFETKIGNVSVAEKKKNTTFTATIDSLTVPGGSKYVEFAVWSEEGGISKDLEWVHATGTNGGSYSADIQVKNHKKTGLYHVHAYANDQNGKKIFLGATEFTVTTSAIQVGMTVDSPNNSEGTFKVTVTIPGNTGSEAVESVVIPVWCSANQSDLHWYTAEKQADGTFTATVSVRNHKNHLGTYKIHAYTTFENGIQLFSNSTTYEFNPSNFVAIDKTQERYRNVTLMNCSSSVSKVSFAVWSDDKGIDDVHWYSAAKQSDGTWTATISAAYLKSAGTCYVHCYQDDQQIGGTSFYIDKSELVKNGWYYENGYKFYYKDGVKQTDLTNMVSGPYYICVNRTTCTVTVYANDPDSNKGYIVPVIAFTCSVGLPETPTPTGDFQIFVQARWAELMGPSYGQYASKFSSDGCWFHSVAGSNTTSHNLNSIDYNNLGIPASHGCVRLCVRDAKWIYEHCGIGTRVHVYDSSDPGPFGKPATIKIPAGQTWDPTDPEA